jgi:hypothetical protein
MDETREEGRTTTHSPDFWSVAGVAPMLMASTA